MLEWMITYTSSQHFELEGPSEQAEAREEFADFDIEIDPEVDDPPFEVSISNKVVADLRVEGTAVHRHISCAIAIKVTDLEAFNKLLDEESWYDPSDGEYEISSAVNYWICDTTCAPDYANFISESCDYDVVQISRN